MIRVAFQDVKEIRMGSPYNVCRIRLSGPWVPNLPNTDWQDLSAQRDDGEAVALVRWDTPNNEPGFRIVVINSQMKTVRTSQRFQGCCQRLSWLGPNRIAWRAFPDMEGVYRVRTR